MKWRPWNVMEGCISCKQYKRDICRFALDPKGKPIGVAINNACHSSEMDQTCEEVCWVKWRQNNNQDFTLVTGGLSRPQLQGDSRHPPPAEVSRERGWMVSWLYISVVIQTTKQVHLWRAPDGQVLQYPHGGSGEQQERHGGGHGTYQEVKYLMLTRQYCKGWTESYHQY